MSKCHCSTSMAGLRLRPANASTVKVLLRLATRLPYLVPLAKLRPVALRPTLSEWFALFRFIFVIVSLLGNLMGSKELTANHGVSHRAHKEETTLSHTEHTEFTEKSQILARNG